MNKKSIFNLFGLAILVTIVLVAVSKLNESKGVSIVDTFVNPHVGLFEVAVTSTGEIEAESSVKITGPSTTNRRLRLPSIQIIDMVEEGIDVKAGDYIATLDRTDIENSYKDAQETLETRLQSYELALLDSMVSLTNLRSSLKNSLFSIEAAEIQLDQNLFQSPAKVRDAERNVEKAKMAYEAAVKSYELSVMRQIRSINRVKEQYEDQKQLVTDYAKLLDQLVIHAPSDGVLNYHKERSGEKRKVGSSIDEFDNVIAVLPDMSSLITKTYVNEIDVNKLRNGQSVLITVDALVGKSYTGKVISVANVGEQLPNADAKVFEVIIRFDKIDSQLRTSMTTGNKIITNSFDGVMSLPLGCINRDENNIPFVYLKGGVKQIVVLGDSNYDSVIIEQGLKANSSVYLTVPSNVRKFKKVEGEELITVIRERENLANTTMASR